MVSPARLRAIYEAGARISQLAGLEAVWDAAQLDILRTPEHHHRHPKPVVFVIPDRREPAQMVAVHRHHPHHHEEPEC